MRKPLRAAAYTRTGILMRFLEQLAHADPGRVDAAYAEQRLGLKGGDVRAFLQSLRVLGLIELHGETTPRARRMRAAANRGPELRQALAEAYPELFERWLRCGGMSRGEVEDFFKVEYGLSASSAGPAAKLFLDLIRMAAGPPEPDAEAPRRAAELPLSAPRAEVAARDADAPPRAAPAANPAHAAVPLPLSGPADVRLAALEALRSSIQIRIDGEWDPQRIELVFDRMERLVDRILAAR